MTSKHSPVHRPIQPWISAATIPPIQRGELHYREFITPPAFRDIVPVVWTLTGNAHANEPYPYHVVPDACSDLIFDCHKGEGYIFGTVSGSKIVVMGRPISLVGVRLQSHLLPAYIRMSASQLRDMEIPFRDLSIAAMNDLFEGVVGDERKPFGIREAQALAEAVAKAIRPERINIRALWLTRALLAGGGSVDRAAHITGFCTRQLRRIAEQDLGLSPKRLGRILRLQRTFPVVLGSNTGFALIADEHGYADQAHMIREFSSLTGHSPGFWRARRMSDLFNKVET